jgi:hypothetical protein
MARLSWNLGVSTSWKPQGLSRPVMGVLDLYRYLHRQALSFSTFRTIVLLSSWNCKQYRNRDWCLEMKTRSYETSATVHRTTVCHLKMWIIRLDYSFRLYPVSYSGSTSVRWKRGDRTVIWRARYTAPVTDWIFILRASGQDRFDQCHIKMMRDPLSETALH